MKDDFADWYGALWPRVLRAVTVSVGDRDLAEEATAEAFAKALVRWPAPAKADSPAAWLHKVALNEVRSRWRRRTLERRVVQRLGAEPTRRLADWPRPSLIMNARSVHNWIIVHDHGKGRHDKVGAMERRRLGRIGHESSVLIYGAAALADVTQEVADASIDEALAAGINHFDVAAGYGDAELRLGAAMDRLRGRVFLATKTGERSREAAWRQINESLERLRVDRVDLLQLHAIGDLAELDAATASDGALHAAVRAQDEGLIGDIGITGHGHDAPAVHLEALQRFPFATVLTPLNPVLARDETYLRAYEALAAEIRAQDVGLMIIKTVARQNWPDLDQKTYATWYEPFDQQAPITASVSWVLAREEVTGLATPGDVRLLPLVIRAEQERHSLDAEAAERVLRGEPVYSSPFVNMPI